MTDEDLTIDELSEKLRRQIVLLALSDPNAQFKLDAYRATVERGKAAKPAEAAAPDAMATFRARVRNAEGSNGAE